MHIGLVTPGFSESETDWCIPALLDLVRELARAHTVEVFTLRYPYRRGTYRVYGATVHALGGGVAGGLWRVPLLACAVAQIAARARQGRFDVLHAFWADEAGFVATTAGRVVGTPALVSLSGGELAAYPDLGYGVQLSRAGRWLVARTLRAAQGVTTGSEWFAAQARAHSGRAVWVAPLGVDEALFYPAADAPDPAGDAMLRAGTVKLLHVASLVPVKEQGVLLEAFARVAAAEAGVHLHIVGEGPGRAALVERVRARGLAARVTLHGAVPHERLPAYYRAADLCVLASRSEGEGMVVLEAAACARPTVGTAVGILPELGAGAWVVPCGDSTALAEGLLAWVRDAEARRAAGAAALAWVRAHAGLAQSVERWVGLYARVRDHV